MMFFSALFAFIDLFYHYVFIISISWFFIISEKDMVKQARSLNTAAEKLLQKPH